MPNDIFNNLDSIVLSDQPDVINMADYNVEITDGDDKSQGSGTDDKSDKNDNPAKDDKKDDTEDKINPDDFFKRAKAGEEEEEEEEEEESDTKKSKKTPKADDDSSDAKDDGKDDKDENPIKAWGEYFKEEGVLLEEDLAEWDGTIEGLVSAFKGSHQREGLEMVEDYKSQLPPMLKHLAENWEEGVPLDELVNIKSNQIRYSSIDEKKLDDEDGVELRKSVMTSYLKETTRLTDAKISKLVQQKIDLGDDVEEAKENLVDLKKFEVEKEDTLRKETKAEQGRRREENAKVIKSYEKAVSEIKEIIPGIKVSDKETKDILNKIINPIGVDGHGNQVSYVSQVRNEDPIKFDTALNYVLTITKGFSDWSKISTAEGTKATKSLAKILETKGPKSNKNNINTSKKASLMDILEYNQKK